MKKDAYYFPHDSNAKDDPKCILLIEALGLEAYGIYWVLVELLRDQPNLKYPLKLIPPIARRFNTTEAKMKAVILKFGLFAVDDDSFFFSQSLIDRMQRVNDRRKALSDAGRRGNEKRWGKMALPSPPDSDPIAIKGKETKGNDNKPITDYSDQKKEIESYFKTLGADIKEADNFFDYYESVGWEINRKPMKNWKAASRNWLKRKEHLLNNQASNNTGKKYKLLND